MSFNVLTLPERKRKDANFELEHSEEEELERETSAPADKEESAIEAMN